MRIEQTYTRLAVPDLWNKLTDTGMTPTAAYAQLVLSHGITGPADIDDYERFIEAVRSEHNHC